jgi:hypothetical protein
MPGWRAWQTADAVWTLIRAAPLDPSKGAICPQRRAVFLPPLSTFGCHLIQITTLLTERCTFRLVKARLPRVLRLQYPPALDRRQRACDPILPKDLRLLYILDGFGG